MEIELSSGSSIASAGQPVRRDGRLRLPSHPGLSADEQSLSHFDIPWNHPIPAARAVAPQVKAETAIRTGIAIVTEIVPGTEIAIKIQTVAPPLRAPVLRATRTLARVRADPETGDQESAAVVDHARLPSPR